MTDDDLRAALLAADPGRLAAFDPVTSPRARELMERTMTTEPNTEPTTDAYRSAARAGGPVRPSVRRSWLAAAAAVVLAGSGGAYLLTDGDPAPRVDASTTSQASPTPGAMVLTLPGEDATASCAVASELPRVLAGIPLAFAGTVTETRDGTVHLTVTRWYRGGDATTVVLRTGGESLDALLGPLDFQTGRDVLVASSSGEVARCGMSGPAVPELRAAYEKAFGA